MTEWKFETGEDIKFWNDTFRVLGQASRVEDREEVYVLHVYKGMPKDDRFECAKSVVESHAEVVDGLNKDILIGQLT